MMLALGSMPGGLARAQTGGGGPADGAPVLGAPFTVEGVTYTPADPAYYDEVGYAASQESGGEAGKTSTGEAFAPTTVTASHKTLPLPSYVEVTALDSGRTILVRVNDRGPMRNDRLIALSSGAREQLGIVGDGAAVRVRRVNPPEQEKAVLRSGGRAAERLETPAPLLKALRGKLPPKAAENTPSRPQPAEPGKKVAAAPPSPAVTPSRPGADFDRLAPGPSKPAAAPKSPAPKPAATKAATPAPAPPPKPVQGRYDVQIGAFSTQARAQQAAKSAGARVEQAGMMWRVRLGPYPTLQAAQAAVKSAAAKGFENGRIVSNDAR
ncbi:septal ring lytic transglycosylase RlpA family protein [Sphingobium olei]|uniref:Endolytic peptidoglycan transglycosylase RlpA n=1 Tax=Sphingobium olei TaxID=420955 RepID=A0ABW3NXZ0_9SPHN